MLSPFMTVAFSERDRDDAGLAELATGEHETLGIPDEVLTVEDDVARLRVRRERTRGGDDRLATGLVARARGYLLLRQIGRAGSDQQAVVRDVGPGLEVV